MNETGGAIRECLKTNNIIITIANVRGYTENRTSRRLLYLVHKHNSNQHPATKKDSKRD